MKKYYSAHQRKLLKFIESLGFAPVLVSADENEYNKCSFMFNKRTMRVVIRLPLDEQWNNVVSICLYCWGSSERCMFDFMFTSEHGTVTIHSDECETFLVPFQFMYATVKYIRVCEIDLPLLIAKNTLK